MSVCECGHLDTSHYRVANRACAVDGCSCGAFIVDEHAKNPGRADTFAVIVPVELEGPS